MSVFRYMGRALVVLAFALISVAPVLSQEEDSPGVAFVINEDLRTALPGDTGPDGVSRLANIFSELGAEILSVDLSIPIPDEVDVLLIIRPQRQLSIMHTAHLYQFLQRGGRLVLAVDPNRYGSTRLDTEQAGIDGLLAFSHSVNFQQTLLIEPWFTFDSLAEQDPRQARIAVQPETSLPHPITTPLLRYDLPLQLWGGRSLQVEPFGMDSFGTALLFDTSTYGESSQRLFRDDDRQEPVEFTEGVDVAGRLPVGGIGINVRNSSMVVLLGDGEMLQNGFGLELLPDVVQPLYAGNFLFAERMAAWLLQLPPAEYPALPEGITWLAVDGGSADWDDLDVPELVADEEATLAAINDSYLYVRTGVGGSGVTDVSFNLIDQERSTSVAVFASADLITINEQTIPDGAFATANVTELRLPVRLLPDAPRITDLCATVDAERVCLESIVPSVQLDTIDPVPLRIFNGPTGIVRSTERINIRSRPSTDADVVRIIDPPTQVAVLGRNALGDWVFVRNGAFEGWLAVFLVDMNINVQALEVLSES